MARGPPVAAFTKMSNGALAANRALSASRSCTSQTWSSPPARTLPWARCGLRLAATTDTPSLANWLVAAKPIPEVPPRTMARFPCSVIGPFLFREFLAALPFVRLAHGDVRLTQPADGHGRGISRAARLRRAEASHDHCHAGLAGFPALATNYWCRAA